jgi:hypothetical protein
MRAKGGTAEQEVIGVFNSTGGAQAAVRLWIAGRTLLQPRNEGVES